MTGQTFQWQNLYRCVLPHKNGEEALLIEWSETDTVFSSGWVTASVDEQLTKMGWKPVEKSLPPALADIAHRRLAEDRPLPSSVSQHPSP